MCLRHCPKISEEVLNGEWPRKVYKVLRYSENLLLSPIVDFSWKVGVNQSSRTNKDISSAMEDGFHAWLAQDSAEMVASEYDCEFVVEFIVEFVVEFIEFIVEFVVEFIVQKEDFVGAGFDNDGQEKSALFLKLELKEEEYEKAMKMGSRLVQEYGEYDDDDYDDWDDWDEDDDDWDDDDDDEDDDDWDDDEECNCADCLEARGEL